MALCPHPFPPIDVSFWLSARKCDGRVLNTFLQYSLKVTRSPSSSPPPQMQLLSLPCYPAPIASPTLLSLSVPTALIATASGQQQVKKTVFSSCRTRVPRHRPSCPALPPACRSGLQSALLFLHAQ